MSPFEEAVTVSIDGFGDFSSAAWGVGNGCRSFDRAASIFSAFARHILPGAHAVFGFPHYGDEYKVMGLAPYGKPTYLDAMRKVVCLLTAMGRSNLNLAYFRHHRRQISYQWADGSPEFGDLFTPALEDLLGPRRKPTIRSKTAIAISPAPCRRCMKRPSFI